MASLGAAVFMFASYLALVLAVARFCPRIGFLRLHIGCAIVAHVGAGGILAVFSMPVSYWQVSAHYAVAVQVCFYGVLALARSVSLRILILFDENDRKGALWEIAMAVVEKEFSHRSRDVCEAGLTTTLGSVMVETSKGRAFAHRLLMARRLFNLGGGLYFE